MITSDLHHFVNYSFKNVRRRFECISYRDRIHIVTYIFQFPRGRNQVSNIAEIIWVNHQGALKKQLDPGL